jgi:hypothetical protein
VTDLARSETMNEFKGDALAAEEVTEVIRRADR